MNQGQGDVGEKLERLYAKGLIDLETLLEARRIQNEGLDSLNRYLAENGLEASSGFCQGQGPGEGRNGLGSGGIQRGRGDAAMRWGDPASEDAAQFREQILDPAGLAALSDSQLIGLTPADPTLPEAGAPSSSSPTARAAPAGGGGAYTHTLLPRHRGAVRRYFDRPQGSP